MQRFVLAAVRGADDGSAPTLLDARRRLAGALGAERAEAELQALVWANVLAHHPDVTPGGVFRAVSPNPLGRFDGSRLSGVGALPAEDRTMFWSTERLRSERVHLHVTTAEEERAIAEQLEPGWKRRSTPSCSPAASRCCRRSPRVCRDVRCRSRRRGRARTRPRHQRAAGTRENDAMLCIEVERTNHVGSDGADFEATVQELRPEEPMAFTRIAIVRDGRLVAQVVADEERVGRRSTAVRRRSSSSASRWWWRR